MARRPRDDEDDSEDSKNAEEIARLQWKRTWTLGWFIFWIALIAAFPCCCAGSFSAPESVKMIAVFASMCAPFVGLGGIMLMWSDRMTYTRALALAKEAHELGLKFKQLPSAKQYRFLNRFQLLHEPTNDFARNFAKGKFKGDAIVVVDYSCSWGIGKWAYVIAQTTIVFKDAVTMTPNLVLYPRSLFKKVADAVGLGGKSLSVSGKFNKAYNLYGAESVVGLFGRELIALCLNEENLALEVQGQDVLAYWVNTNLRPNELEDRIRTAHKALRLLREKESE